MMNMRIILTVIIGLSFWLSAFSASAQTKWPTTDFQLEQSGFYARINGIDTGEREAMRKHLVRTAKHYEAMGFRPPDLEMDRSSTHYIINLDYKSKSSVAMISNRAARRENIIVPIKAFAPITKPDGKLNSVLAYNLSHELFHAVQRAYPGMRSENAGHWVLEGTAEAISRDLMVKWKYLKNEDCDGVRDIYQTPLGVMDKHNAYKHSKCTALLSYGTSGLWRYLGQAKTNGKKLTGYSKIKKPNYSYLVDFFNYLDSAPLQGKSPNEYSSVDGYLRKARLGGSLPHVFTSWAAAVTKRPGVSTARKLNFISEFYRDCPEVKLPESNPFTLMKPVKLQNYTASCFHVMVDPAKGPVDITIDVTGKKPEQLFMGLEGGLSISAPPSMPSPPNGETFASWTFTLPAKRPNGVALILARADSTSSNPYPNTYTAMISMNSVVSSGSKAAPKKKSAKSTTPNKTVRAKEHNKAAAEARNLSPSYHTSLSAFVSPQPKMRDCREPYRFMACGPSMTVSLSAMPNSAPDLSIARASGGGTSQIAQSLLALKGDGSDHPSMDWMKSAIDANRDPGRRVDITFPYLDYGQTASFTNAIITTGNGEERGILKSISPTDAIRGKGIGFELNGQVTIDHYSMHSMSGSYSGTMVDDQDVAPVDDPTLRVITEISGTFHIARPWKNDYRIEAPSLEFKRAMKKYGKRGQKGRRGGNSNSGPGGGNGTASTGVGGSSSSPGSRPRSSNCKCRCDYQSQMKLIPGCIPKCTPVWNLQCPLPKAE